MFNIFAQLDKELEDFNRNRVLIAGSNKVDPKFRDKPLSRNSSNHTFSQRETVQLIELYYNSRFESGNIDSQGQRKVFLNISKFRSDVASKMVDLDTKDFLFIPKDGKSQWPSWFLSKEFKQWAKDTKFGKLLNEIINDCPKYGTVVLKEVGNELIRVQLSKLRNTQDALTLKEADYVIEELEYSMSQLSITAEERGWSMAGLPLTDKNFDNKIKVFERYGLVTENLIEEGGSEDKLVKAMTILTLEKDKKKDGELTGTILFIARREELPYHEVHWSKQDGRWLGIGEIENQFENQLSRNVIVNLRRRALLYSSKKVFQSTDDTLGRNLIKDVSDGDVLRIGPNGAISQVDMTTRALADFNADEQVWEENSNQKSFTFEVATGEKLPSGTPFRLGVILSSAVKSHFELKREEIGMFLKDVIMNFVVPKFKDNTKEHLVNIHGDVDGIESLREAMITFYTNQNIKQIILGTGTMPDVETIRAEVEEQIVSRKFMFFNLPDGFYENITFDVDLVITGESMDVASKVETFKSLLQIIAANPAILADPNARQILSRIVSLTGESLESLVGRLQPAAQGIPQAEPGLSPGRLPIRGRGVRGSDPGRERLTAQPQSSQTTL